MIQTIELRFDDGCTVAFLVESVKGAYVHFGIEFRFHGLDASLPSVGDCSLSNVDVARLVAYADASVDYDRGESPLDFTAYDAFFNVEFLEGDAVRLMASYGPDHSFSLGVEGTVSGSALLAFRDGWKHCLA